MSRLIDADKLLDALYETEYTSLTPLDEISRVIDYQPTVDAVPVKRGKWTPVKYNVHCSCGKSYGTYHYLCLACNHVSYAQPYGLNFCPNCGADMREVQNERD